MRVHRHKVDVCWERVPFSGSSRKLKLQGPDACELAVMRLNPG